MQSNQQFQFGGNPIFGGIDWSLGSGGTNYIKEVGLHVQNSTSVREYAYFEDKNYKFRPQMEDTYSIKDQLAGDSNCGLFSIFDGHGGKQVADYCADRIQEELKKEVQKSPGDLCYAIEGVFLKIDDQLRLIDADNAGATACVCIVRQEYGHKILYIANVGDTRAVLSKNGAAERMSQDHKATEQTEIDRIKGGGGILFENRVGGSLAVTRAFGDHSLKSNGVTAKPYINKHVLRPFDKFLVIASDGVWDVIEDQEAINFCKEDFNCKEISRALVKSAIDKGSRDNISCIVLRFNSTSPF